MKLDSRVILSEFEVNIKDYLRENWSFHRLYLPDYPFTVFRVLVTISYSNFAL